MTTRRKATLGALAIVASAFGLGMVALRPGSNHLRVRVETLQDEDGHLHRRWTFTGAGRWESFGAGFRGDEHFVVLDRAGARDSNSLRLLKNLMAKGADRVVYEVEAHRLPPGGPSGYPAASFRRALSGNGNGGSPRFNRPGVVSMTTDPWAMQFKATQVEETTLTVPTKLRLGEFGGTTETIEFR